MGDRPIYYLLAELTPTFLELFKVQVDFEDEVRALDRRRGPVWATARHHRQPLRSPTAGCRRGGGDRRASVAPGGRRGAALDPHAPAHGPAPGGRRPGGQGGAGGRGCGRRCRRHRGRPGAVVATTERAPRTSPAARSSSPPPVPPSAWRTNCPSSRWASRRSGGPPGHRERGSRDGEVVDISARSGWAARSTQGRAHPREVPGRPLRSDTAAEPPGEPRPESRPTGAWRVTARLWRRPVPCSRRSANTAAAVARHRRVAEPARRGRARSAGSMRRSRGSTPSARPAVLMARRAW